MTGLKAASRLELRVQVANGAEVVRGSYAVASVFDRASRSVWEGAVPLDGTKVCVPVGEGQFKAVLRMPSGEMFAEDLDIATGETRVVTFELEEHREARVPAWATYLKQIAPVTPKADKAAESRARVVRLTARKYLGGTFTTLLSVTPKAGKPTANWSRGTIDIKIEQSDEADDHGSVALITILTQDALEDLAALSTIWLYVVLSDGNMSFAVVPPTNRAQIFVKYDGSVSGGRRARLFVTGSEGKAESLLGYLNQGALSSIRTIASDVIESSQLALRNKYVNPASAAVGAYALLSALPDDDPRYRDVVLWTRNLCDWFPALADGAVLSAWFLLRDASAPEEALKLLLIAEKRGLPMFTRGLKLLLDGLEIFRRQDSGPRIVDAIGRLHRFSPYADLSAAHTTIEFDALSGTRSRKRKYFGEPNLPFGENLPTQEALSRFVTWLKHHRDLAGADMLLKRQGNHQRLSGKFNQSFFGAYRFLEIEPHFVNRLVNALAGLRSDDIYSMGDGEIASAWIDFLDMRARERTEYYSFPILRGYLPPKLGGTLVGGGGGGSTFKRMLPVVAKYLRATGRQEAIS